MLATAEVVFAGSGREVGAIWWVERNTSGNRWIREQGDPDRAAAERAAKWYRREYRRKARAILYVNGIRQAS